MATKAVADLIARVLGKVFTGIDADNIFASVWGGLVLLSDVALNKSDLNPFLGDIQVVSSHIEQV